MSLRTTKSGAKHYQPISADQTSKPAHGIQDDSEKHSKSNKLDPQHDRTRRQRDASSSTSSSSLNGRQPTPLSLNTWTILLRKIVISLSVLIMVYVYHYMNNDGGFKNVNLSMSTMASSQQNLLGSPLGMHLKCPQQDYHNDNIRFESCAPHRCGRFVSDSIVQDRQSLEMRLLAETVFSLIEPSGPVAIFDITSGALSNGTQFINLYKIIQNKMIKNNVIKPKSLDVFHSVKNQIINSISLNFGISHIYLTSPAFFTRIDSKVDQTLNDQYWHKHVDKTTYDGFVYTSLLYLATYQEEFTGGRFIFMDHKHNNTVEPRFGRVLFFTSGSENIHMVERVDSGQRFALTIPFTCDPDKEAKIPEII